MSRLKTRPLAKSVVRSFRIDSEIDLILEKEGKKRGLSVNALVNQLFRKFVEWDRFSEKFGIVSLDRDLVQEILKTSEDGALADLGRKMGESKPKDFLAFWLKKFDLDSVLTYLDLTCRYGNIGVCEWSVEDKSYMITYRHALGSKWSIFQIEYLRAMLKEILNVSAIFSSTVSTVTFQFTT